MNENPEKPFDFSGFCRRVAGIPALRSDMILSDEDKYQNHSCSLTLIHMEEYLLRSSSGMS